MSRRWPPPAYHMEHEEGLPHERQFTIACKVLRFTEVGTGKSKKLAKRMAAHKMWQSLQDLPLDSFEGDEDVSFDDFIIHYSLLSLLTINILAFANVVYSSRKFLFIMARVCGSDLEKILLFRYFNI